MKEKYLEELKVLLSQYEISNEEIEDILADYGEMIDDAKMKAMSDEKIIEIIGSPKKVVTDLSESYLLKEEDGELVYEYHHRSRGLGGSHKKRDNRIVALMPFISLIVFFVLGLKFDAWHPGWLVFFATPITAIIVNVFERKSAAGIISIMPFVATILYLILGFKFNYWHPGWLVFLLIPVTAILSKASSMKFLALLTSLSPFIALTFFFLYTNYYDNWHLSWLVFLIIPILGGLQKDNFWKAFILELSILLAIAAYLYVGFVLDEWAIGLWAFLIPIGVAILTSDEKFLVVSKDGVPMFLMFLACLAIYIGFGLLLGNTWHYLWMIFFVIPMYAIIKHGGKKNRIVALMPFISTVLFFGLGFIFQAWSIAWIVFLLIPMVAIIKNA